MRRLDLGGGFVKVHVNRRVDFFGVRQRLEQIGFAECVSGVRTERDTDQRVIAVLVVQRETFVKSFGGVARPRVRQTGSTETRSARASQLRCAARAVTSGKKYMSLKQVVPDFNISSSASATPSATKSGDIHCASIGQMRSRNHASSGRSSARPRSSTIAA